MIKSDNSAKRSAATELWDVAAHQGEVGDSAPAVSEFLFEILEDQPSEVQVENLDTLYQFSNYFSDAGWGGNLRENFTNALPILRRLRLSDHSDVQSFSELIIENLQAEQNGESDS